MSGQTILSPVFRLLGPTQTSRYDLALFPRCLRRLRWTGSSGLRLKKFFLGWRTGSNLRKSPYFIAPGEDGLKIWRRLFPSGQPSTGGMTRVRIFEIDLVFVLPPCSRRRACNA